jgi:hypothetical protein
MKLLATTSLALGMLLCMQIAPAMTLDPRGTGQVLLFPYFNVNRHQQTLIAVSNLTSAAKVARVRFREAYDGREVLDFNLFLAPHSTWTSALFSLDDAGLSGGGAAILLDDKLCTGPAFSNSNKLPDGRLYQPFLNYAYTGANADTGPTDDTRTREGYFEIIEMAELTGATRSAITPVSGIPPGCTSVATNNVAATDLLPPTGGLSGSEAIVDVAIGTFYATNATALDGVYTQPVFTPSANAIPDLRDASTAANGLVAAYVPLNGSFVTLSYPPEQAVDAAGALLAASEIITDYDFSASAGAQTDWVITFPTKHFYVDPQIATNSGEAITPFSELFGSVTPGRSDVSVGLDIFDRSGNDAFRLVGITTPPPQPLPPPLPHETQVVMFVSISAAAPAVSPALGAAHPLSVNLSDSFNVGVAHLNFSSGGSFFSPSVLRTSHEGLLVQGMPVIGFEAINYVNGNVTPGVLANYSAAFPMRSRAPCVFEIGTPVKATCP